MSNELNFENEEELKRLKKQITLSKEKEQQLLVDKKALMERLDQFNTKAVFCIEGQQWQHALVYLEETERLLESAAEKNQLADQCMIQCVLHNEACCYQSMWQLQQCSNYIQALIFNLNNRKKRQNVHSHSTLLKEKHQSKYWLARYYLQFCAVNSQLSNHSGALVSARKALTIIHKQLNQWDKLLSESKIKIKHHRNQHEEKQRLLNIIINFNDNPNMQMNQTLMEATAYFLKLYNINQSGSKGSVKELKQLVENFTMKSIMQFQSVTYQEYLNCYEKECDMSLYALLERILILSACYFTMGTELRLIGLNKSKESSTDKTNFPQYKQSEIYHLFSILILVLTLSSPSQFLNHLLQTYQDHYGNDLNSLDIPFKKIFTDIITISQPKHIRETSIQMSDQEEGLLSHLSKGSGTLIRFTKSSKHSDKDKKFSWIDPKKQQKKSQQKSKEKSKRKQSTSKPKKQSSSLSKSPYSKSPKPKDSYMIKSPKSKESLTYKSPLASIKQISNPIRMKLAKQLNSERTDKTHSKSKKKKVENRINDYFLQRRGDKKNKKTSVSSKKSSIQPRSTGRLPINSTLQTKDPPVLKQPIKEKKKPSKRSLLQHYL